MILWPISFQNTPNFANWAHWVCDDNPPIDIPKVTKMHLKTFEHPCIPFVSEEPPPRAMIDNQKYLTLSYWLEPTQTHNKLNAWKFNKLMFNFLHHCYYNMGWGVLFTTILNIIQNAVMLQPCFQILCLKGLFGNQVP